MISPLMTMPAPTPSLAEIYTKLRLPAATPIRDSPYAAKFASLSTYTGTLNAVRNGAVISTPSHPGRMPGIAMVWSLVATGAATATPMPTSSLASASMLLRVSLMSSMARSSVVSALWPNGRGSVCSAMIDFEKSTIESVR